MEPTLIVLMLTVAMPANQPDIHYRMLMPSIEECWDQAKQFVDAGVTEAQAKGGAVGVSAACGIKNSHSPKT